MAQIRVLGTGGMSYREWLKRHSTGIARLRYTTGSLKGSKGRILCETEAEITLGYILRDDLGEVRIGHCVGHVRDNFEIERKQRWELLSVSKTFIKELVYLG